ncbi:hypothetical protein T12_2761 [Trichinella patagoniensis]|uniref:Uncharacterized protein n=1 Tax=Trichinella patagoniensis TaxID=990121 RepID=A0A0V0ZFV3_9BILA|nr:hypothetical protein T12_2761 [Trichinella patagoniensis]
MQIIRDIPSIIMQFQIVIYLAMVYLTQRTSHVAEENSFNPENDFTSRFRWSLCQWTSDPFRLFAKNVFASVAFSPG